MQAERMKRAKDSSLCTAMHLAHTTPRISPPSPSSLFVCAWKTMYIKKKLKEINERRLKQWTVNVVNGRLVDEPYPINALRNIALRDALTEYVFLSDADFVPSPDFQSIFARARQHASLSGKDQDKLAFVAPAFEHLSSTKAEAVIPLTKYDLYKQVG